MVFGVFSKGEEKNISTIAEEPSPEYADELSYDWIGIQVIENSAALSHKYSLHTSKGLVVAKVRRGSAAGACDGHGR